MTSSHETNSKLLYIDSFQEKAGGRCSQENPAWAQGNTKDLSEVALFLYGVSRGEACLCGEDLLGKALWEKERGSAWEESAKRFCHGPAGWRALQWGELSPCQEDTPHATSRTCLDAAFKEVRLMGRCP